MNLSALFALLEETGAFPKRSLSQNFLIDGNILRKIVRISGAKEGERVLEIGPGPGALTEALLEAKAEVVAVEKDERFVEILHKRQLKIDLIEGDILEFDFKKLPPCRRVVANIPYAITTPILEKLLTTPPLFETATLLVQREVAERIVAKKGTGAGALSLFVQYYAEPKIGGIVPASAFYPAPKVDSAILHLILGKERPLPPERFFPPVRRAFQQRRKQLKVSLKPLFPSEKVEEALSSLGHSPKARPEELDLADWLSFLSLL